MKQGLTTCIVCETALNQPSELAGDVHILDCPRCGKYLATRELVEDSLDDRSHPLRRRADLRARVSYHLHLVSRGRDMCHLLTPEQVEQLARDPYRPSLGEQIDNLLLLVGERSREPGRDARVLSATDQYRIGAQAPETLNFLVQQLRTVRLLEGTSSSEIGPSPDPFSLVRLTLSGWERYDEIVRRGGVGRRAFLAMPFNRPELDKVWLPPIRAAVEDTGFQLRRVDDDPRPGIIDVRMRQEIRDARFAIVELTFANLGAYWEAGFAEGLGKPVIYTCRADHEDRIHFDTSHLQRITWDPAHIPHAANQLKAMIRLTVPEAKP